MRPPERRESGQNDLFRSRLDQIIDMKHALVKLAYAIDWRFLESRFGEVYEDGPGRSERPETWVTGRTGHMGYTFRLLRREGFEPLTPRFEVSLGHVSLSLMVH
jgi:hypothetical protein